MNGGHLSGFCKARVQKRGDARCRLPATVDCDGDGYPDACHVPKHQREVRKDLAIAASLMGRTPAPVPAPIEELYRPGVSDAGRDDPGYLWPGSAPVPAPTSTLEELPPAPAIAETILGNETPSAELGALEARALSVLGEVPEDAGAADSQASTSTSSSSSARLRLTRERFTEERVKHYLTILVEPKFIADGKEPFTDEEIDEGAELGSILLQQFFGEQRASSPGWALVVWGAFVLGDRYHEELLSPIGRAVRALLTQVMRFIRGDRSRRRRGAPPAAAPAAPPTPAPRAAPELEPELDQDAGARQGGRDPIADFLSSRARRVS